MKRKGSGQSSSQHKISVTKTKSSCKKPFDNLLLVDNQIVKPHVYIIHSPNFKSLVQQLTGNRPIPPTPSPLVEETDIDTSTELSFNPSEYLLDYSLPDHQGLEESSTANTDSATFSSEPNAVAATSAENDTTENMYREMESWLLEMDPTVYNSYHDMCYDHDLYHMLDYTF